MVILVSIVILLLVENFCCYGYCKLKKNRSIYKAPLISNDPIDETTTNETSKRSRFVKLINWIESWIRLKLIVISYIPSHSVRKFFLRFVFCADIDKQAVIYYGTEIRAPWNLHIGRGTVIGDHCILDARSGLFIGQNVNFSTGVWIWTLQHNVNSPSFSAVGEDRSVVIKDRAWLSCRSVVLPGCTINEGAVVAAGCVVTKDCESYGIYGGMPNKQIGKRNTELTYELGSSHMHFL